MTLASGVLTKLTATPTGIIVDGVIEAVGATFTPGGITVAQSSVFQNGLTVDGDFNVPTGQIKGGQVAETVCLTDQTEFAVALPGAGPIWRFWFWLKAADALTAYSLDVSDDPDVVQSAGLASAGPFNAADTIDIADGETGTTAPILISGQLVWFSDLLKLYVEATSIRGVPGARVIQTVSCYRESGQAPTSITLRGNAADTILATSLGRARMSV